MRSLCQPEIYELVHVIGNVGKPGLTLLVPPEQPMVRTLQPSSWKVLSNTVFNGKAEDCFQKTTMHLPFTEYYRPAHFGDEQGQDSQIFFLESVVSVYDAGEWVGDVDIPSSLGARGICVLDITYTCKDPDRHQTNPVFSSNLISAECWDDILDPPSEGVVIRAYGNWIARLAAISILVRSFQGEGGLFKFAPETIVGSVIRHSSTPKTGTTLVTDYQAGGLFG